MPRTNDQAAPSQMLPTVDTVLSGAKSKIEEAMLRDPAALGALGAALRGKFTQYEYDRRVAELQWERNARQYLGVYDPDIEKNMDINRSRAYPKITRVKCVSMLSRLMNLLFPVDDKNWDVDASPLPNLSRDDLQKILDGLMPAPGQPVDDEAIEEAIREFAKKRARNMSRKIDDQLAELGAGHGTPYTALCRKVLQSGIQYGAGILKGPFVEERRTRSWMVNEMQQLVATESVEARPCFDFVPIWDYYPDLSAKTLNQMQGQFERIVMSKHHLIKLKNRPDFIASAIDEAIRAKPAGNYVRRAWETELRAMGPQQNAKAENNGKYEVLVWTGYVNADELANCGVDVPEKQEESDVRAIVWLIDNQVIKVEIDPWTSLLKDIDVDEPMRTYHIFTFEENESFLLGNGLPQIMRDSQMSIAAVTRMMIDNGSIQRNLEVNTSLISSFTDVTSVQPDKIWYREDEDSTTLAYPAIRPVNFDMRVTELQNMLKVFMEFADAETFVNPATGGDMQRGPSEPFRSAAGASMLRGDAALPFKDVVRNFDMFTESVINSLLLFNRVFNADDESIQGDFTPVARGATSLIAKEVLGIQLDALSQTLAPEERIYLKNREMLMAKLRVRDMDTDDLVVTEAEARQIDANNQQMQQSNAANAQQMFEATLRDTLANALKNIAQAGKNAANADATTANATLDMLQKPLTGAENDGTPTESPQAGTGGGGGANAPTPAAPARPRNGNNAAGLVPPMSGGAGGGLGMPLQ